MNNFGPAVTQYVCLISLMSHDRTTPRMAVSGIFMGVGRKEVMLDSRSHTARVQRLADAAWYDVVGQRYSPAPFVQERYDRVC